MPMTAGTGRHLWAPKPTGDKVTSEDSECRTLLAVNSVTQEGARTKGYMPVPLAATRAASARGSGWFTLICGLTKMNAGPSHRSLCGKGCYSVLCCCSVLPWSKRAVLDISLCARSDLHPSSALDKPLKLKPKASWAPPEHEERFADDSWHWPSPLGPRAHRG